MNEYQLTVTKRELNLAYATEHAEWQQWQRQNHYVSETRPEPAPYIHEHVLSVTVDAATFAAIRKAALETL